MFQGYGKGFRTGALCGGGDLHCRKKLDKFSQKQSAIVPNLPEMPGLALLYLGM
jgi:hypothetical protein